MQHSSYFQVPAPLLLQEVWKCIGVLWVQQPREQVYPMVAAVQQDPHGEPAFFHRVTPGAKYDPARNEILEVAYVTTPLR